MHLLCVFAITLSILYLFCFVQALPLCYMASVPVWLLVVGGCIWVGLFHMLGCGGGVLVAGSYVLGLVAGLVGCSGCNADCCLVHCCVSFFPSF